MNVVYNATHKRNYSAGKSVGKQFCTKTYTYFLCEDSTQSRETCKKGKKPTEMKLGMHQVGYWGRVGKERTKVQTLEMYVFSIRQHSKSTTPISLLRSHLG